MIQYFSALFLTTFAYAEEAMTWKQLTRIPNSIGVAAPFAGVSGGALVVAGGANFPDKMPWEGGAKVWHDRVWLLEKADGAWREAGRLPHPLAYGVSVSDRDGVVCVGGSDATQHYADAFRLVWSDGALSVEPLPPLPIALANSCGALVGESLVVAGGAEKPGEQVASNRAFALNLAPGKPAWHELPPLPGVPRILAVAGSREGVFYVFGGATLAPDAVEKIARVYLREAWSYRADQGWRRLADVPKPIVAAPSPAPFVGGKFFLLAGDDGSGVGFQPAEKHPGFPKNVLAYDPALDRWSDVGETPAPRATVPCVEWSGMFVMPSGEVRPGVRSTEVWGLMRR